MCERERRYVYIFVQCRIAVDDKGKCSLVGSICTLAHYYYNYVVTV